MGTCMLCNEGMQVFFFGTYRDCEEGGKQKKGRETFRGIYRGADMGRNGFAERGRGGERSFGKGDGARDGIGELFGNGW